MKESIVILKPIYGILKISKFIKHNCLSNQL